MIRSKNLVKHKHVRLFAIPHTFKDDFLWFCTLLRTTLRMFSESSVCLPGPNLSMSWPLLNKEL